MAMRIGGSRRKTRQKFTKHHSQRGKVSPRRYLQDLPIGSRVALIAEPAVQSGMYFRRFHGKAGKVTRKLGSCYEVTINDLGKEKRLIVHPVHLRRLEAHP